MKVRTHRAAAVAGCSRNRPTQVARCVQRRRIIGSVATREVAPSVSSSSSVWDEFAQNATGEWEGVSASFDAEGKALPLPDYYVPSAYRDWGVEIADWQTVCSSTATPAPGFLYKLRRMMPTVGCEADAVAYTEDVKDLWSGQGASWPSSKPVLADGSFFAGPLQLTGDDTTAKVELCLTLPPAAAAPATPGELQSAQKLPATLTACRAPTTGRLRHRVVATFMKHWKTKVWTLNQVEVNRERYDGPYREVVELSGCGGGMSAIAKSERDAAEEQLAGSWRLESGKQFKRAEDGSTLEAQDAPSEAITAGGGDGGGSWEGALALPVGTYVRWQSGKQGDGFALEVGVALEDPAARRLGAVTYAQGTLQAVMLATAKRL